MADVAADYRKRVDALQLKLDGLDQVGGRLANARVLTFLLSLGPALGIILGRLPTATWFAVAGSFLVFLALGTWHSRVIEAEKRTRVAHSLNERGLLRVAGQWRKFASKGEGWLPADHLYAADLDVLGQGSLFQRLDETGTNAGEALLARWLLEPAASADQVRERQGAVQELSARLDFRQALVTEAKVANEKKADPGKLLGWVESPSPLQRFGWARPLAWVPVITVALSLLASRDVLPPLVPAIVFVAQLLIAGVTWKACADTYQRMATGESGFVRFERTFAAIAAESLSHPKLHALKAGLDTEGPSVVERLRRFSRLYSWAELRSSGQYHALINVLLLWDLHFLFRLERWRVQQGKNARRWFEALAELEALSAMATYAYENPTHAWPEVDDGPAHLVATGLGHPLLDAPVRNDVSLEGPGHAYVITGSNMSGKTTLLRAMGLNAVMALAGLPVCASAMKLSRLTVLTSMRVKDSLERGVSYFYAEVQRIKAVLDAAKAHPGGALFLLDELLMGTNAKERQVASRELMRLLLVGGAVGGITTHDLSLTELAADATVHARNVHFRDHLEGEQMRFDYLLKDGVVQTTNALALLRAAGVPV